MKTWTKLLLSFGILIIACGSMPAYAEPAHPKPATVTLPDGSTLTLHLYGDEFGHYTATSDGYEVASGADGFFYHVVLRGNTAVPTPVRAKEAGRRSASDLAALTHVSRPGANNAQRLNAMRSENVMRAEASHAEYIQRSPIREDGEVPKSLVLLVNYTDVKFTTANPQQAVHNLLNQPGYSNNSAIGSARDYYYDNSNGRFDPQFDVFGPYELDNSMEYYGGNDDANAWQMAYHACQKAYAAGVDFTRYLNDQGKVKDVYIFYAGYAESYSGNNSNTVWPHRWANRLSYVTIVPGLPFTGYACSSEFWGWESSPTNKSFASIGTFCHEYGHVLGWPDFYDTDGASNGTAVHMEKYSLMSGGNHNANGTKPPALLAVERKLMGWLENETPIAAGGSYELPDIYTTDKAYILQTENAGEYYLFEARNSENNKWDAGLRNVLGANVKGMLVTHIDRSSGYISRWSANDVNDYSAHPCARVVKANKNNSNSTAAQLGWMFTGSVPTLSGNTHPEFVPWSGTKHGFMLQNIAYANGKVTFNAIEDITAESITLDMETASVLRGKQITLTPNVLPENTSDKTIIWKSADESIATIKDGVVKGVGGGMTTITATLQNASYLSASCMVTVVDEISTVSIVSVYQNDAELSWENSPHDGAFRVELYSGGRLLANVMATGKYIYFSTLKPITSYTAVVTAIYGDQSEGSTAEFSFATKAATRAFPSILVEKTTYGSGEAVPLRVLHTSRELQSVVWEADGAPVSPPSVVLQPGRHRITVTVTNEGGYSEKITKYITVQ